MQDVQAAEAPGSEPRPLAAIGDAAETGRATQEATNGQDLAVDVSGDGGEVSSVRAVREPRLRLATLAVFATA